MKKLIAVNKQDKIIGYKTWQECHSLRGIFHRAFSIFVVNNKSKLLLQKRSKYKPLWPLFWSNTCCSHLRKGEAIKEAARQRLKEELGFTVSLKEVFKFNYQAIYEDIGSENEVCTVLVGKYNGKKIRPDKKEVVDYKWVSLDWLKKDLKQNFSSYTPWFKIEFKKLINQKFYQQRGIK